MVKYPHIRSRKKQTARRARLHLKRIGIGKASIAKMSDRSAVGLSNIMQRHKTKYAHMKKAMEAYDKMKAAKRR